MGSKIFHPCAIRLLTALFLLWANAWVNGDAGGVNSASPKDNRLTIPPRNRPNVDSTQRTIPDGVLNPYSVLGILSFTTFLISMVYTQTRKRPRPAATTVSPSPVEVIERIAEKINKLLEERNNEKKQAANLSKNSMGMGVDSNNTARDASGDSGDFFELDRAYDN